MPVKKRTKDQGIREREVKPRTTDASRSVPGMEVGTQQSTNRPLEEIANIFNKGVEELSSSPPSSAGRTPTSIPVMFEGSASALPAQQLITEVTKEGGKPIQPRVVHPSDPRTAILIFSIKEKLKKSQTDPKTPTPKSGEATARSTPSSWGDMD